MPARGTCDSTSPCWRGGLGQYPTGSIAAADRPNEVGAIVSRGGRPDLAGETLSRVRAPTLLIVGGRDPQVLELNRQALARLPGEKQLVVVPGASHLFEEPGTLEQVAVLARDWFLRYLAPATDS